MRGLAHEPHESGLFAVLFSLVAIFVLVQFIIAAVEFLLGKH